MGWTEIIPISVLGYFCALAIFMNFILVLCLFPPIVIIYEKHFKHLCLCCCKRKDKESGNENVNNETEEPMATARGLINDDAPNIESKQQNTPPVKKKMTFDRFMEKNWSKWIFNARYIILIVITIWSGIAIFRATKVSTLTEFENLLPDDHPITKIQNMYQGGFHSGGAGSQNIVT